MSKPTLHDDFLEPEPYQNSDGPPPLSRTGPPCHDSSRDDWRRAPFTLADVDRRERRLTAITLIVCGLALFGFGLLLYLLFIKNL